MTSQPGLENDAWEGVEEWRRGEENGELEHQGPLSSPSALGSGKRGRSSGGEQAGGGEPSDNLLPEAITLVGLIGGPAWSTGKSKSACPGKKTPSLLSAEGLHAAWSRTIWGNGLKLEDLIFEWASSVSIRENFLQAEKSLG